MKTIYILLLSMFACATNVQAQQPKPVPPDTAKDETTFLPLRIAIPGEDAPNVTPGKTIDLEKVIVWVSLRCDCAPRDNRRLCGTIVGFEVPITWLFVGDKATLTPDGCSWTLTTKDGKSRSIGSKEGTSTEHLPYRVTVVQ